MCIQTNLSWRSRWLLFALFLPLAGVATLWILLKLAVPPPLVNRPGFSQAVYDRNGKLLRLSLTSDEKYRFWTPLSAVSPLLVAATLQKEDNFFWRHPGVNPVSLVRAALSTYFGSGRRIGGSTISMQLARIRFGINSKTPLGKLTQIVRALQLERHYSKREILEAYLNLAPYGGNIEGVEAASLIYFSHPSSALTQPEAFSLAVMPQSPARRAPERSGDELGRARIALEKQSGAGESLTPLFATRRELPFDAPHFTEYVRSLRRDSGRLPTTLDLSLQHLIEHQIAAYCARHSQFGVRNASAMLVDYRSMEVRALVGSRDYADSAIQGQVNVTLGRRSPGSALKPFIYALAIDQGRIHPSSMLKDTRRMVSAYNPENFDREFLGPLSATDALIKSRNVPAIDLTRELAAPTFYEFLRSAQIGGLQSEAHYGLALALGGVEITMHELVALYAMLANGGELRPLRFFSDDRAPSAVKRMLSTEASYLVIEMLKRNPRPQVDLGEEHSMRGPPIPWKTGTSFGFRDAWSVGMVGPYVLAVWIGNADGSPNPSFVGRETAGPLFFSIADALRVEPGVRYADVLPVQAVKVSKVHVCQLSGMLPGPHCPRTVEGWFIPGKSPIESCSVHREVAIDKVTHLRACPDQTEGVDHAVYEFWPSDILALFRSAGVPRRVPPPYQPKCGLGSEVGKRPLITSPQSTLLYTLRFGGPLVVPFSAVTDADSSRNYWFVNDTFAGEVAGGQDLHWQASPGEYVVRVADEQGRAAAVRMRVQVER